MRCVPRPSCWRPSLTAWRVAEHYAKNSATEQPAQRARSKSFDGVQTLQEATKILVAGGVTALKEHVRDAGGGKAQASQAHAPPKPFPLSRRELALAAIPIHH